ncbi:MAG TPA: hypothetical protein VJR47_06590 [Stellaceae bacterium]|nr:hypothetical protein [Stellaceae bacterium]
MFRRRQKHLIPASALPPLLLTLGGLALMWALLQQRATPGFIAVNRYSMIALLALAAVGIGLAVINRARAERRFDATVRTAIERHIDALVQRRQQLRGSESPGPEASRWEQEMKHFIATQIAPLLNRRGERVLQERHLEVLHRIENRAAIAAAGRPNLSLSGPGVSLR